MTLLATFALTLAALGVVWFSLHLVRHRERTPPELEGDWWTPFEREFRAYARRASTPRPGPRRNRRSEPGSTGG